MYAAPVSVTGDVLTGWTLYRHQRRRGVLLPLDAASRFALIAFRVDRRARSAAVILPYSILVFMFQSPLYVFSGRRWLGAPGTIMLTHFARRCQRIIKTFLFSFKSCISFDNYHFFTSFCL